MFTTSVSRVGVFRGSLLVVGSSMDERVLRVSKLDDVYEHRTL